MSFFFSTDLSSFLARICLDPVDSDDDDNVDENMLDGDDGNGNKDEVARADGDVSDDRDDDCFEDKFGGSSCQVELVGADSCK